MMKHVYYLVLMTLVVASVSASMQPRPMAETQKSAVTRWWSQLTPAQKAAAIGGAAALGGAAVAVGSAGALQRYKSSKGKLHEELEEGWEMLPNAKQMN